MRDRLTSRSITPCLFAVFFILAGCTVTGGRLPDVKRVPASSCTNKPSVFFLFYTVPLDFEAAVTKVAEESSMFRSFSSGTTPAPDYDYTITLRMEHREPEGAAKVLSTASAAMIASSLLLNPGVISERYTLTAYV